MSGNNPSALAFYILVQFFAVPSKTASNDRFLWEREHTTVNVPFFIWTWKSSLQIKLLHNPVTLDKPLNKLEKLQIF